MRLAALLLALTLPAFAAEWYVAPNGNAAAAGTKAAPWTFTCMVKNTCATTIAAGDIVWRRGGSYSLPSSPDAPFVWIWTLSGASGNPIWIRDYPGEVPKFDTAGNVAHPSTFAGWAFNGAAYLRIVGSEVMSSEDDRVTANGNTACTGRASGVSFSGATADVHLINTIIHDSADGIGFFGTCTGCEVYGLMTYYNGCTQPSGPSALGTGMYVQNESSPSTRRIKQAVVWGTYNLGAQFYGGGGSTIDDIECEECTVWNAGMFQSTENGGPFESQFLHGRSSGAEVQRIVLDKLRTYVNSGASRGANVFGYNSGSANGQFKNSFILGRGAGSAISPGSGSGWTFAASGCDNNKIYGGTIPSNYSGDCTNLTHSTSRPSSGSDVFTVINAYEKARALVLWFNHENAASIEYDPSSFLVAGDRIAIYDAHNPLGAPVATMTYTGSPITLQKSWESLPAFVGTRHSSVGDPVHSDQYFRPFLIRRNPTTVSKNLSFTQPESSGTQATLHMGLRSDSLIWPTLTAACTVGNPCVFTQGAHFVGVMHYRVDYRDAGGVVLSSVSGQSSTDAVSRSVTGRSAIGGRVQ